MRISRGGVPWLGLAAAAMALAGLPWAGGCASSSSSPAAAPPCNEEPFQCGAGQTCWPQECTCPAGLACDPSDCTPRFACVAAAGDKQQGDPCQLRIGQVTCGDHQTCVDVPDAGGGACRAYCVSGDRRRDCAAGFQCVELGVGSSSADEHVCVPLPQGGGWLGVDAGEGDAGDLDPDALPVQPDAWADVGRPTM